MEENQNHIPCNKDAGIHPLLYYSGLNSVKCIKDVGDRVWMQTDPELVVPRVLQSLENLKHLVSILNCPQQFVTPSLHVYLYIQSTEKVFCRQCNLFGEKVIPNGFTDLQ